MKDINRWDFIINNVKAIASLSWKYVSNSNNLAQKTYKVFAFFAI